MVEKMFTISLRIEHPSERFEAIAQKLALSPVFGYTVGDQRRTPKGRLLEGVNERTYCYFDIIPKQAGDFIDGLRQAISRLDFYGEFFRELTREGGRVELYAGIFVEGSTGFTLSVNDLEALRRMALELSVEVYY